MNVRSRIEGAGLGALIVGSSGMIGSYFYSLIEQEPSTLKSAAKFGAITAAIGGAVGFILSPD